MRLPVDVEGHLRLPVKEVVAGEVRCGGGGGI